MNRPSLQPLSPVPLSQLPPSFPPVPRSRRPKELRRFPCSSTAWLEAIRSPLLPRQGKTVAATEGCVALAIMQGSVRQRFSQKGRERSRRAGFGGGAGRVHGRISSYQIRRRSVCGTGVGATSGDSGPTGSLGFDRDRGPAFDSRQHRSRGSDFSSTRRLHADHATPSQGHANSTTGSRAAARCSRPSEYRPALDSCSRAIVACTGRRIASGCGRARFPNIRACGSCATEGAVQGWNVPRLGHLPPW